MTWEPADDDGWQRSGLRFAFYNSLVDDDPATVAPALEAYGRVAASWARLEHHIDALLIQVNKPDHDPELYRVHPASFSRKIDLLKAWFNKHPPLSRYTEDMRVLTSKLTVLAKDAERRFLSRNVLMHAIPASYDPENRAVTFHHIEFVGTNLVTRHIVVTINQLETFFDLVQMANTFLARITTQLFTLDGYERLKMRE